MADTPVQQSRAPGTVQAADAATAGGPLNTLTDHYASYFASPRELEWYRIGAADKARNAMDLCRSIPHESIIDIGAGDGAVLNLLDAAGFGSRLHAVEISTSGLDALAKKSWTSLVEAKAFDGYHIPYADNSFDLAILSHVVEHVEHPRLLLHEAARVARRLYVEVPMEFVRSNRKLHQDFVLDATGHINFYNPDLIRLLVQSCGLRVVRQETRHTTSAPYRFQEGRKGLVKFAIKESLLRIAPRFATTIWNYHCAMLCEAPAR